MRLDGTFRVFKHKYTLRNMEANSTGYIMSSDCILSKKHFCVSLDTRVYSSLKEIEDDYFAKSSPIAVYRIDKDFTCNSFIFDVEERFYYSKLFDEHHTKIYLEDANWIVIDDPEIEIEDEDDWKERIYSEKKSTVESVNEEANMIKILESNLEEARQNLEEFVNTEDYERAAEERDEIMKMECYLRNLRKESPK